MKRILIFSLNYYPRFIGGAEIAIKEITDRISPEEYEFHVLTLRFDSELPKQERIGNVLVHRFGLTRRNPSIADLKKFPLHYLKYWYQIAAVWHAVLLHLKYRFDGTWAMMAHSCAIPAGIFKFLNPSVKYLLTLQEGDPPEHIESMMRRIWPLFKQGFTRVDMLQPISTFLLAWGRRMGFNGTAKVIPNAADVSKFSRSYSSEQISNAKEKLGKKPGDVFLITSSRLVYKNAVDDVINALLLLPGSISFVICGIGPDEEMLRARVKELHLEERVRFLGEVANDELPLLLKACDIFIRPSRSEGFGISFVEAMAAEIPVIATHEGGIPDFLFDAKKNLDKEATGWVVDKDSSTQIAEMVTYICNHPEEVKKTLDTASILVRDTYSWDLIARQMKDLFTMLLKNS